MSEVWHSILTGDCPCWVAFEGDHCVLLTNPGPAPAWQAEKRLIQAPTEGEVVQHELGYLFITAEVFTLVRHSEVETSLQVREVALRKRQNHKVTHVQWPVPVERLSNLILGQASKDKVEAVGLEPTAQGDEVRFLREGTWSTIMKPPVGFISKLINYWRPRGLKCTQGPWGEGATLTIPS
jgi:hypothetical protein